MKRSAWDIADEMAHAFDPDTGEVDQERWEELALDLGDKAEAIHAVLCRLTAEAAACSAESDRLRARSKAADAKVARLRSYLLDCMHVAGLEKLQTRTLTVIRRIGSERVDVSDLESLPDDLVQVSRTADKRKVLEALKRGLEIRGATITRGPDSLVIR